MSDAKIIADRMRDIYKVTGDRWFNIAAEEIDRTIAKTESDAKEIAALREALEPFAGIANLVNHTERRDGERVFELPKLDGGYWTLVREDFRRAKAAYEQAVGE